jgi:hypothetical protein
MTPDVIRMRIEQIRERLACVAADRWIHEFTTEGEIITTVRAVMDGNGRKVGDEAPETLCRFGDGAAWQEKELLREARKDIGFLLDQLTRAGRMIRELRGPADSGDAARGGERAAANLAAEASMKCAEPAFQKFLSERHATDDDGDLGDAAIAAAVLRRALSIESRRQINTDPEAARRWRDLRAEFQAWGRG